MTLNEIQTQIEKLVSGYSELAPHVKHLKERGDLESLTELQTIRATIRRNVANFSATDVMLNLYKIKGLADKILYG